MLVQNRAPAVSAGGSKLNLRQSPWYRDNMRPPNLWIRLSAVLPAIFACHIDTPGSTGDPSAPSGTSESSQGSSSSGGDSGSGASNPSGGSAGGSSSTTAASSSTDTTGSIAPGSTGDTTEGTTTSASACPNGIHEADEECDDGNDVPDDGCNNLCGRDRVVFVSSKASSPEQMGSAKLAGDFCKQLAGAAGLANAPSFGVWLSDSKMDARDRVHRGRGRYVLVDGRVVADSFEALLAADSLELQNPIELDEHGALVVDGVWTGTNPDGSLSAGASQCKDWSSGELMERGHYGSSSSTSGKWTLHPDPDVNPTSCVSGFRTYCFEGR